MAVSQNGWPVVGKSSCDQGPFAGVTFPNGILKGDVATIARWQLAEYERRVEQLVPGTCWGWFVKSIEGSTTISNHSSGTAWDINATQHPMGVPASHNMSAAEISACHGIEADSDGTLRWGGDFSRPDPMHWEIIGSRAAVAAFATKIRNEEDDHMTLDEMKTLAGLIGEANTESLLSTKLGTSGPNVAVVLQTGVYQNSVKMLALLEEISAKLTPVPEGS